MKRFLWLTGVFCLCGFFVGCTTDQYSGLISSTISRIDLAATEVGNIKARVDEAVKRADNGQAFDLTEAVEATKKLKETGVETQKLKGGIESVREKITEEDRQKYAKTYKEKLNVAFSELLKQREELRMALTAAEKHGKSKVKALRDKITEAEGPFESLAR